MSKRKKSHRKTGQASLDKLARDLRAHGLPENVKYTRGPAGEPKMSAVFWEFIEPFKKHATTSQAMHKLVTLGVFAWNAALFPKEERQKMLDEVVRIVLKVTGEVWRDDVYHILSLLLERKERFFSDDRRYIVSYHLEDTGAEYRLVMASTELDMPREKNP